MVAVDRERPVVGAPRTGHQRVRVRVSRVGIGRGERADRGSARHVLVDHRVRQRQSRRPLIDVGDADCEGPFDELAAGIRGANPNRVAAVTLEIGDEAQFQVVAVDHERRVIGVSGAGDERVTKRVPKSDIGVRRAQRSDGSTDGTVLSDRRRGQIDLRRQIVERVDGDRHCRRSRPPPDCP